jgi:hypothetical protein
MSKSGIGELLKNETYVGTFRVGRVGRSVFFAVGAGGTVRKADAKRKGRPVRNPRETWTVLPDVHQAIIDRDLFDAVQAKLVANRKCYSPSRKRGTYPLAQLLRCAHYGSTMHGTKDKSGKPVYRCMGAQKKQCPNRSVREDVFLPLLIGVIRNEFLRPENLARLRRRAEELEDERLQGTEEGRCGTRSRRSTRTSPRPGRSWPHSPTRTTCPPWTPASAS